jgi:hypothetical protein
VLTPPTDTNALGVEVAYQVQRLVNAKPPRLVAAERLLRVRMATLAFLEEQASAAYRATFKPDSDPVLRLFYYQYAEARAYARRLYGHAVIRVDRLRQGKAP